jgi:hypothetical protein
MFSSGNQAVMIAGILLALTFICGLLYFVNKMFANDTQEILVRFILLVFTALVGVWVVDKIIAFRIKLLDAEQGAQLFDLIKTLILMIFSYYFGSKKAVENKK